jgi:hypothetical protein
MLLVILVFNYSVSFTQNSWGEYTLVPTQNQNTIKLLDLAKNAFHTWTLNGTTTYTAYLLPGDTLIRSVNHAGNSFTGGPISGQVQKVDWNGNIVWDFVYSTTTYCSHHDICPMPNGNVLLIAYEAKTAADATNLGCTQSIVMWPDKIVEIQPTGFNTGNVVWEWHAWDHTMQNVDATKSNYVSNLSDHPELLNINYKTTKDWMHMNGVDYNAAKDQIAFSSHNLNEVYVIDHSTTTAEAATHTGGNSGKGGDLLFRWGNPAAYNVTTPATNFNIVHDAHWVPSGSPSAGYLVGYNNNGQSAASSYVDLFNPPMMGNNYVSPASGQAYGPTIYDKRITCTGHTSNMGNSQQLPNGNMLICVALDGLVYEIDSLGTTIWSYQAPGGGGPGTGSIPQASRYTACYVSGKIPNTPTITESGIILQSSIGYYYQWYLNGNLISGATTQNFTPSQSGSYQVRVLDSIKCGSALSTAKDILFSTTENIEAINSAITFYPNPTNGVLTITNPSHKNCSIQITDLTGKQLIATENTPSVNLSNFESGIYLISITNEKGNKTTNRVVVMK